jgi:chemotaxis protein histidine kinase CheA
MDRQAVHQAANAGRGEEDDRVIDRFKQGFLEEARELLSELESALLELDDKRDDPEIVGRAFRALHTIKGSGAMFGFDEVAGFAHNLEAVFDQLRKGELAATADLISLTLAAGDQIKSMLYAAAGQGATDPDRSAGILAELRRLTGSPESLQDPRPVSRIEAAEPGVSAEWHIHFQPGRNVILNGTNLLLLLGELRELGQLRLELDTTAIPPRGGKRSGTFSFSLKMTASSRLSRVLTMPVGTPCRQRQPANRIQGRSMASMGGPSHRAYACRPKSWMSS